MRHLVISGGYDVCMETNTTFINNNTKFTIVQIKEHSENFSTQLGWSHFAEIKRVNGRKSYYANLLIVDGAVVQTKVVM
jgi:hypothetical protein